MSATIREDVQAVTAAFDRADAEITRLVEGHLLCRACARRIVQVQRAALRHTVLGDIIRERTEAAEA